jgi:BlaI family penicillinase repressor
MSHAPIDASEERPSSTWGDGEHRQADRRGCEGKRDRALRRLSRYFKEYRLTRDYSCGNYIAIVTTFVVTREGVIELMNSPSLQITDAEWDIMQAVWQADDQMAGDIITKVQESRDWNHRTIRTLIARLVDKEAIGVRVDGNTHLYRALVSRDECVRSAARSFSERFFSGDIKSLLVHFVENEEISQDELDDVRRLLRSKPSSPKAKGRKG